MNLQTKTKPKPTTTPTISPTEKPSSPYNPGPGINPEPKA